MLRSRRVAFIAAAVLVGLSSCGDSSPRVAGGTTLPVIRLGAAPALGGAQVASDRMMMPMQDITFVFDGSLPDLGGRGRAWTMPAGARPDLDRVAALAALLGVEGDVRELPADQGGGWMVGAADYSSATLGVGADGLLGWWFNPAPGALTVVSGCAIADSAVVATEAGVDSTAAGTAAVAPPEQVCEEAPRPVGVPDEAAALAAARQLFTDMGYDLSSFEFDVYADEWGANVTGYRLLGGQRSPISVSVGFGAEGAITWASGSLAEPVEAGEYPLVGVDAGVIRLNDETGRWAGYWGGPWGAPMAESGGASVVTMTASAASTVGGGQAVPPSSSGESDVATVVPGTVVPDTMPPDGGPLPIEPPSCAPGTECTVDAPPPPPITVHLDEATLALTMVWAADSTIWLLPAYTFTSDDGGQYSVIAVDDSFIALPDPGPAPVPLPAETVAVPVPVPMPADTVAVGPPVATIDPVETDVLVGIPEDEAATLAAGRGWAFRVVVRDGVTQPVTADYSPSRVNVEVSKGVVAVVSSIG